MSGPIWSRRYAFLTEQPQTLVFRRGRGTHTVIISVQGGCVEEWDLGGMDLIDFFFTAEATMGVYEKIRGVSIGHATCIISCTDLLWRTQWYVL